jgi:hypothetical protein
MKVYFIIISIILCFSFVSTKFSIETIILNNFLTSSKKETFKIYHYVYKKTYDLNSEEGIQRYNYFKDNLKAIETLNNSKIYELGLGPYSDMSNNEFLKVLGLSESTLYLSDFNNDLYRIKNYKDGSITIPCSLLNKIKSRYRVEADWFIKLEDSSYGKNGNVKLSFDNDDKNCINSHSKQCATFYTSDCKDTKRKSLEICDNELFWSKNHEDNINIYGYKLGDFHNIIIFDSFNCTGRNYMDNSDEQCLATSGFEMFDRRIQSFVLLDKDDTPENGCIHIYSEYCLIGQPFKVCESIAELPIDIKVKSVRAHPGVKYTLHELPNYKGSSREHYKNIYSLFQQMLDKKVRSVTIRKQN